MMQALDHDVVVLGAGPAGVSAAIRLSEMGLDVALIERTRFPRHHVGICISDDTLALIDFLGVGEDFVGSRFWRRNITGVRWGDYSIRPVPQLGYHLDRGVFDAMLMRRAVALGIKVFQPAGVLAVDWSQGTSCSIEIGDDGERQLVRAGFVVDATGRRPTIRGSRIKDGPPLIALHARWTPRRDHSFDGMIEAGNDAWLWYAQTAADEATLTVFCDPRRLRSGGDRDLQKTYVRILDQFETVRRGYLGQQAAAANACDATSHHASDPMTDRYIRLGDACFCVDPLASQGVHLALQSGLLGAIIVNTLLRKPENGALARRFFESRVATRVALYSSRTRLEYGRVGSQMVNSFWRERSGLDASRPGDHRTNREPPRGRTEIVLSPDLSIVEEPVIDGTFVEMRPMLKHDGLQGDVRYANGVDLPRLIGALPNRFRYADLPAIWRPHVEEGAGRRIAEWLWERGVLEAATDDELG